MKYSLRSLMIVAIFVPPMLAYAVLQFLGNDQRVVRNEFHGISIAVENDRSELHNRELREAESLWWKSGSVIVEIDGRDLRVNGEGFGDVKAGDIVTISKGQVQVNQRLRNSPVRVSAVLESGP